MITDGITFLPGSTAKNLVFEFGVTFPVAPISGQKFRLTTATGNYLPGEYWYNSTSSTWSPASVVPYDIAGSILGKPTASAVVMRFVAVRPFSMPVSLTSSLAKAGLVATATAILSIQKNGVQFATITFTAAQATATFTAASATGFVAGDILTVVAPGTVDATLGDVEFTFVTTLV